MVCIWSVIQTFFSYRPLSHHWKLILDLGPNILEKDRFITGDDDDDNEKKFPSLKKPSSTPSMTQMYSQQLQQQRNELMDHDPYGARAIKIQSKMD